MDVTFEGFIPILGGNEGKVEIGMDVIVEGLSASEDGHPRAASEITDFVLRFNGARLPLGVENVEEFFPRTTVTYDVRGRVLANDAPKSNLPVKLPALEQDRFAEITYLPIVFPAQEIAEGASWSFEREFGQSTMQYEATLARLTDERAVIEVKIKQEYTVLEDEALNVVANREDAVAEATTRLTGRGTIEFDRIRGRCVKVAMDSEALTQVTRHSTNQVSERRLKITHRVTEKRA